MSASARPKVLLLMPHLGGGGAERVMALVTRGLSAEKYELHLGLIAQTETGAEGLPPWVHLHVLGASRVRGGAFRLLRLVRRLNPVGNIPPQLSCSADAPAFPPGNTHPGASEWNRFGGTGFWRPALV